MKFPFCFTFLDSKGHSYIGMNITCLITSKYPNKWAHFKTTKSVQKFSLLENVWKILWIFPFTEAYCYFPFHICNSFEWLPDNSMTKGAKMLLLIILKQLLLLLDKTSLVHREVLSSMRTCIQIPTFKALVLVNLFCENMLHWQLEEWQLKFRRKLT